MTITDEHPLDLELDRGGLHLIEDGSVLENWLPHHLFLFGFCPKCGQGVEGPECVAAKVPGTEWQRWKSWKRTRNWSCSA